MGKGSPIARLFVRLGLEKDEFNRGAKEAKRETQGLVASMNNVRGSADLMTGALQAAGVMGLAYMAKEAAGAVWELGELGARSKDVMRNLESFAGGADKAALFMKSVGDASGNTVADMKAAETASRLLQMGIADTAWEMDLYVEGATRLGSQSLSASQRIDEMAQFLKNLNMNMADNFGLSKQVLTARTQELQATQGLSREEALLIAIQEEMARQLEVLGPRAEDGALAFDQLDASVANLKESLAGIAAGPMTDVATTTYVFTEALQGNYEALHEQVRAQEGAATTAAGLYLQAMVAAADATTAGVGAAATLDGAVTALGEAAGGAALELDPFIAALQRSTDSAWDMWGGLQQVGMAMASLVPEEAVQGWRYIREEQGKARDELIRDAALRGGAEVDAADTATGAWRSYFDEQDRAYDDLRNTIQSSLRPSKVTPLDMGLAASGGGYEEKWDENARRLDAVAQRGFAELDAHPDWAGMLKIPPEVLAAGEAALKDWAGRTAGAVRNLERPDLLNVDAALQAVQDELNRKAAVELSLDLVTNAAVEEGLVSGEDAKSQVAQMLGLEAGPVQLPYQLVPFDEGGEGGGGMPVEALTEQFMGGVELALDQSQMMSTFVASLDGDIKAHRSHLTQSGTTLWQAVEVGIWTAMHSSEYVIKFAQLIAPEVARIIIRDERWTEE